MNVLAFKDGRLVNAYSSFDDAEKGTGMRVGDIQTLVLNGKSRSGYTFDLSIKGIDYTGWGYEDARNRSL